MMRRRVVVTGIGTISAAGGDTDGFVEALSQGRQCFSKLDDPGLDGLRATHAGLVFGLKPNPDDPRAVQALDRNVHLALIALREALSKAGLKGTALGSRAAVVLGTCSGGMLSIERHYEGLARGVDLLDESLLFSKQYHTAAKILAWASGAGGPVLTVVTACAAGAGAIAKGADLIRAGLCDLSLVGGSDTFAPSTLAGFDALKATSVGPCAPFSKNIGLNLGEGAAFLVLESLKHAQKRGVPILAELLGYGLSNDAYHPTTPDPTSKGQTAAMARALLDGGVVPEMVDYVNAHGTGTRANDPAESRAIQRLLKDRIDKVPVSATKSMIGHCLGGAGALEASATILSARAGFVPPTAGFEGPRDGCNLPDYVPDAGRKWTGRIALANSFGFGGNNATLLLDVAPNIEQPVQPLPEPENRQAVITGVGLVSALGLGIDPFKNNTQDGITSFDRFDIPHDPCPAGLVPPINPRDIDRRLDVRGMDRCSTYATMAVRCALLHADLKPRPGAMAQVGMVMGLATGPSQGESDHLQAVYKSGFKLDRLGAFPYVVPNSVAGNVSRSLMLKGHNTVLAGGKGAGLAAMISSAIAVEQGHVDTVLATAADELTERTVADGLKSGRFGPGTGITPGEGAAAFVIENKETAVSRGAGVLAEIKGYALATDVDTPFTRSSQTLIRALNIALERAEVDSDEISLVATGGGGHKMDNMEINALNHVFDTPRVVSFADRVGVSEACLPLINLSYLLATGDPETLVAATFLGEEGFAGAVIIHLMKPV